MQNGEARGSRAFGEGLAVGAVEGISRSGISLPRSTQLRKESASGSSSVPRSLRGFSQLETKQPILWTGYDTTPGLDPYRREERFSVWLHTHQQLLDDDEGYNRQHSRFQMQFGGAALFGGLVAYCTLAMASLAVSIVCGTAGGVAMAYFVWRSEQRRRNAAIGRALTGR